MEDKQAGVVRFLVSSEFSAQVQVKVDKLKGRFDGSKGSLSRDGSSVHAKTHAVQRQKVMDRTTQLRVECALYYNGHMLCIPISTRYVTPEGFDCTWNENLTFCVKYKDLPLETQITFTVWPSDSEHVQDMAPVGGCTLRLFSKKLKLRTGKRRVRLWRGQAADGSFPTETPGKIPVAENGHTGKLERLLKHYNRGDMPKVRLLDNLCIDKITEILAKEERDLCEAGKCSLQIDLPQFPLPVMFQDSLTGTTNISGSGVGSFTATKSPTSNLIVLSDPEIGRENPAERKAQRLARSEGPTILSADKNLKPNSNERRAIESVLRQPPTQTLGRDAKKLLWRFRYSLKENPKALVKFLLAVDWQVAHEVQEALTRLHGICSCHYS